MHTFASQKNNRVLHARFSGVRLATGALRFPAFLLVWSIGVVLATGAYFPADALVRLTPIEFQKLQSLPSLKDDSAFDLALEAQLRESTVVAGDWQPEVAVFVTPEVPGVPEVSEVGSNPPSVVVPVIHPQLQLKPPGMTKTPIVKARPEFTSIAEPAVPGKFDNSDIAVDRRSSNRHTILLKREARRALAVGENLAAYAGLMGGLSDGARDSGYLGLLALAALASGHPAEARLVYQRLLVMEPDNEQWWAGLAVSSEQLGLEAAVVYQEALARSDENSKVQELIQTRLQELG